MPLQGEALFALGGLPEFHDGIFPGAVKELDPLPEAARRSVLVDNARRLYALEP